MAKPKKNDDAAEQEKILKQKHGRNAYYLRKKLGITRPVAEKISRYCFGDCFIGITPNHDKCKFDITVNSSVSANEYTRFIEYWAEVFNVYQVVSATKKK